MYAQPRKPREIGGPGEPPPGFVTPPTSATEWVAYWGLWRALGVKGDPRESGPPFMGAPTGEFAYQSFEMGGRMQAGGAVVDYVVYSAPGGVPIGIRLVTEYFHLYAGSDKIMSDALQKDYLSREMIVVDLLDSEILGVPPSAVIIKIKQILNMIPSQNPITAGTVHRNRPQY